MLRCRVRYFTDGAMIGSKGFVDKAFAAARDRLGSRRWDGARRMRGSAKGAAGTLWSMRDLRVGVHRVTGRVYVFTACLVSGPASLVMAFYANGGIASRIAFVMLALLWLATTGMGWWRAMRREWGAHREWMIRSYALTISAITLRAWKWVIVAAFEPPPMDVYRLVAWLGFLPNLIFAEWWIRRGRGRAGKRVP